MLLLAGCTSHDAAPDPPIASATPTTSPTTGPVANTSETQKVATEIYNQSVPIAVASTASELFAVPNAATELIIYIELDSASAGPYAVYGDGAGATNPTIRIVKDGSNEATVAFAAEANQATSAGRIQGPTTTTLQVAGKSGDWNIAFDLGGSNIRASIKIDATFG